MITRRSFLVRTSGMLAMAGASGALPGCASVVRGDFSSLQTDALASPRPDALESVVGRDGVEMLELASLAPSSHNVQPWHATVESRGRWLLRVDPARRLPVVDPSGKEMWLSLGAFVENLDHAARSRGLRLETETRGPLADAVVEIRFNADASAARSGAGSMPDRVLRARRTVRKGFLPVTLTRAQVSELLAGIDDARFIASGTEEAAHIAEAVIASTARQNADPAAMRELGEWIHWSNREAALRRDGLTHATMDITGLSGLVVRTFFSKETVSSPSFADKGNAVARAQAGQGAGWILISGGGDTDPHDLLEAGRRFERLSLRACRLGIGVHPMSQPLEESPWREALPAALGVDALHFLLRVGLVEEYPEPVSLRRPLRDFTFTSATAMSQQQGARR